MIEFTKRQQRMIALGVTALALALVFAFTAAVTWAVFKLFLFSSSALVPVMLGFFLALFFRPYYLWWLRWLRNPTLSLVAMLLTVGVPLGLIFWHAGALMIDQLEHLVRQGPQLYAQVSAWFQSTFPKLASIAAQVDLPFESVGEAFSKYGSTAIKAGSGALHCVMGLVSALVTLLFFVFFLMNGRQRRGSEIVRQLAFLSRDTQDFLSVQIDTFVEILVSFFQRQVIICLIEGVLYGTGFWAVGLPYGFLLGFLLGVFNLIPLFGSVVCMPVALPIAYFGPEGSTTRFVLVLAVWLTGQLLDGYLITPRIQGDKTGLGYAGVIFSFFFWATVLGPLLGMLLAIPLSAFCVVLWRAVKSRYFRAEGHA